jgi:hypothetical protein
MRVEEEGCEPAFKKVVESNNNSNEKEILW